MTTQQLKEASKIALETEADLSAHATSIFSGFGLPDFKPVVVTIHQLAWLIRYQCAYMLGCGHDAEALQEIARLGRKRFQVI